MCTAFSFLKGDLYFGRTLDLDCSYGEEVCVLPRNYPFRFREMPALSRHYAILGMATVAQNVPLLYDAVNEYGLAMAGLNFPGNAYYPPVTAGKDNLSPFEFIPWILGQCKNLQEARILLKRINLADIPFSQTLPLSPLHWIIADRQGSLVVESMKDGLHIHENPVGVMTNNPPFDYHLFNLNNYRGLQVDNGENLFDPDLELDNYCQGLGAVGLPGDVSSMSRFVRIAFGKAHAVCEEKEESAVSQVFHLLCSVAMNRGICRTPQGHWDITVYSACMNVDKGLYYYTTYDNSRITCVDLHRTDLEASDFARFPLITGMQIAYQN